MFYFSRPSTTSSTASSSTSGGGERLTSGGGDRGGERLISGGGDRGGERLTSGGGEREHMTKLFPGKHPSLKQKTSSASTSPVKRPQISSSSSRFVQ